MKHHSAEFGRATKSNTITYPHAPISSMRKVADISTNRVARSRDMRSEAMVMYNVKMSHINKNSPDASYTLSDEIKSTR